MLRKRHELARLEHAHHMAPATLKRSARAGRGSEKPGAGLQAAEGEAALPWR